MKSREGKVVDADDIIEEMITLAENEIKKRYKDLSKKEIENRSKIIGLGALVFYLLKIDPARDINFDPKESINFEGDTGPYVQYAHARCCSILKKTKLSKIKNYSDFNEHDFLLIKELGKFSEVVRKSAKSYNPSIIAHYLLSLVKIFNEFYEKNPVLKAEKEKNLRVSLVYCTKIVLKNGLNLLSINAPEEM